MKSETEVATIPQEVAPSNLLQAIMRVATNPDVNIDVIERMVAIQERLEAKQRETAFMAALARLQAKVPLVHKGGTNTFTKTTYARREDIQRVIQPLLAAEGFSMSFDEQDAESGWKKFFCKLSHAEGHSEVKSLKVPIDEAAKNSSGKPTRTGIQDVGSTAAYTQRYLIKMWLNMAETDEDTDGASAEKITDNQAKDLELAAKEAGLNIPKFFVFMKVGGWDEIMAVDLKKAINAIEVRRQENAKVVK